MTSIFQLNEIF